MKKHQQGRKYRFFVGIDVSKEHLDFALYEYGQFIFHRKTPNNISAVRGFLSVCTQKVPTLLLDEVLFCLEHTGMYGYPLISALLQSKVAIWIESGLKISRSLGLQRGKNDKLDAQNIAQFAYRYQDKVKRYQPASEQLQQLEALFVLRSRLVKTKKQLLTPLKEAKQFTSKAIYESILQNCKQSINAINIDIKNIEKQMEDLVKDDPELKKITEIVSSVPGVDKTTSYLLLIVNEAFTKFDSAKQLACYAGVVPFDKQSGKSIKGKKRVSKYAHHGLKTLLHMCALSAATQLKGKLKDYFDRKVAQGKKKMAVLNAVRNKLIHHIFACVKKKQKYDENYTFSFA